MGSKITVNLTPSQVNTIKKLGTEIDNRINSFNESDYLIEVEVTFFHFFKKTATVFDQEVKESWDDWPYGFLFGDYQDDSLHSAYYTRVGQMVTDLADSLVHGQSASLDLTFDDASVIREILGKGK